MDASHASSAALVARTASHRGLCVRTLVTRYIAATFAQAKTLFGRALVRRFRREDFIAAHYAGRSWGDATERELINEIAAWGPARF